MLYAAKFLSIASKTWTRPFKYSKGILRTRQRPKKNGDGNLKKKTNIWIILSINKEKKMEYVIIKRSTDDFGYLLRTNDNRLTKKILNKNYYKKWLDGEDNENMEEIWINAETLFNFREAIRKFEGFGKAWNQVGQQSTQSTEEKQKRGTYKGLGER